MLFGKAEMKEKVKKHRKLVLILIVIAAAAALLIFFICRKKKAEREAENAAGDVTMESAVRQDLKNSFTVQGRVVSGDQAVSQVSFSAPAAGSTSGTEDTGAAGSDSSGGSSQAESAESSSAGASASASDESAVSTDASSGNTVKEVYVKVGDRVNAGDPLFSIDLSDVQDQLWLDRQKMALQQRQNALDLSAKSRALQNAQADTAQQASDSNRAVAEAAEDVSDAEQAALQANTDYQGKVAVEAAAKEALDKAQAAYDAARAAANDGSQSEGQSGLEAAAADLSDARAAYEAAVSDRKALEDTIKAAADAAKTSSRALAKARADVGADDRSKQSAEADARDAVAAQKIANESGLLDMQEAIQKAEEELEKGTIVAGISGTVTAVNIAAGQPVNSTSPVVISNLDDLKVAVDVEEAHIADIFVGQNVYLTTDSTGGEILNGQVTYCAAAPTADASSGTAGTDESGIINSKKKVYYRVEVAVTSSTDRLRVGMNAKMEFVTSEVKDALTVPNDTLQTDGDGDTCVYVLDEDSSSGDTHSAGASEDDAADSSDGSPDIMTDSAGNVYRAVKVTTGVTDGSYTEITSGNIEEGATLYGTGMSMDTSGMSGTDVNYSTNSDLLEGIYQ